VFGGRGGELRAPTATFGTACTCDARSPLLAGSASGSRVGPPCLRKCCVLARRVAECKLLCGPSARATLNCTTVTTRLPSPTPQKTRSPQAAARSPQQAVCPIAPTPSTPSTPTTPTPHSKPYMLPKLLDTGIPIPALDMDALSLPDMYDDLEGRVLEQSAGAGACRPRMHVCLFAGGVAVIGFGSVLAASQFERAALGGGALFLCCPQLGAVAPRVRATELGV
jgi:hypothetical protein